jgi:hypothetical protein
MAKKIKMDSEEKERKIRYMSVMSDRVESAIQKAMEEHEDYEHMTLIEGMTILSTAVCSILQNIANNTNTDVEDHIELFCEGMKRWNDN